MRVKSVSIILMALLPIFLTAQDFSLLETEIIKDGQALAFGLAGGIKAAQYNAIDLDRDGKDDLLVFDRLGEVIMPFLNKATEEGEINYEYAPQYKDLFRDIKKWIRIRDYNNDGIEDIFSGGIVDGIEIRRGYI